MNQDKVIELENYLEAEKTDRGRLKLLLRLSNPDLNYDMKSCEDYLEQAKQVHPQQTKDQIVLHFNEARIQLYQNKMSLAIEQLNQLENLISSSKASSSIQADFYGLKLHALNAQGKYRESGAIGYKALNSIADDIPEKEKIFISLGELESRQGNLTKATENYEAALVIMKKHKLPKEAFVYYNVAVMFAENGDLIKAEKYFHLALEAYLKTKDHNNIVLSYGSLANVYSATNQADKAEEYFQLALDAIKEYNSTTYYFHTICNYGYFLLNQKNYEQYFIKEKEILSLLEKEKNRKKHASFFYQTNSRAYLEVEKYKESLSWIEKAEKIEKESNELKALANILKLKIEIAKAAKETNKVVEFYEASIPRLPPRRKELDPSTTTSQLYNIHSQSRS